MYPGHAGQNICVSLSVYADFCVWVSRVSVFFETVIGRVVPTALNFVSQSCNFIFLLLFFLATETTVLTVVLLLALNGNCYLKI